MTREELVVLAKETFETHEVEILYATNDGMFFTQSNHGDAVAHARKIGSEVAVIKRDEVFENTKVVEKAKSKKEKVEVDNSAPAETPTEAINN